MTDQVMAPADGQHAPATVPGGGTAATQPGEKSQRDGSRSNGAASRGERQKSQAPAWVAVVTAALALGGAVAGAWVKGYGDIQLERQKFRSALVLNALQASTRDERVAALQFLLRTHLIKDEEIAQAIDSLVNAPGSPIPQMAPIGTAFPPPLVENARVYLLAGTSGSQPRLDSLRNDLGSAGYPIAGSRVIPNDDSRPATPEVSYFHRSDSAQAAAVAAILKKRYPAAGVAAQYRPDPQVGPGYFEVWLGKK